MVRLVETGPVTGSMAMRIFNKNGAVVIGGPRRTPRMANFVEL